MKRMLLAVALVVTAASCSKETISTELNSVSACADDFCCGDALTRTTITQSGESAPAFAWKVGDVIGIIPMDGKTVQSNYEIAKIGADPKVATFDGGVWALKEGKDYAAYYPFSRVVADSGDKIECTFLGQAQSANNSLGHIGSYDYMYAQQVQASSGTTTFAFKHLISLIRLQITVPQADEFAGVTLESSVPWFADKAELSLADGKMTATQESKSCTIALDDVAVGSGEVLTVWLATLPTNALSRNALSVILNGKNASKILEVSGLGRFEAGKAYSISCSVTSTQSELESVDMGLSVKWANVNLGAKSPEEYGDYYAWGELKPYYRQGGSQSNWEDGKSAGYAWSSYKWCGGSYNSMTKYVSNPSFGTQDDKLGLLAEDDAATAACGGKWRMPTGAEFQEMLDRCKIEWTKQSDVNGIKVTGPSGNSIFLPAVGYRTGTGAYLKGLYGYYWSSSLAESKPCNAFCLYFSQYVTFANNSEINNRCYGQAIRPVCE